MRNTGAIFYRGPSLLTGDPIVGILTGLEGGSLNPKTGPMVQAWILRPELAPMDAKRQNLDDAICGDCSLRGRDGFNSTCYVTPWLGPHNVWKQFSLGRYLEATWPELQALLEARYVRCGAYGDPAALPFELWRTRCWSLRRAGSRTPTPGVRVTHASARSRWRASTRSSSASRRRVADGARFGSAARAIPSSPARSASARRAMKPTIARPASGASCAAARTARRGRSRSLRTGNPAMWPRSIRAARRRSREFTPE